MGVRSHPLIFFKMCITRSMAGFEKDVDFLDKVVAKKKLRGKAVALEMVVKMIKRLKLEGELR